MLLASLGTWSIRLLIECSLDLSFHFDGIWWSATALVVVEAAASALDSVSSLGLNRCYMDLIWFDVVCIHEHLGVELENLVFLKKTYVFWVTQKKEGKWPSRYIYIYIYVVLQYITLYVYTRHYGHILKDDGCNALKPDVWNSIV